MHLTKLLSACGHLKFRKINNVMANMQTTNSSKSKILLRVITLALTTVLLGTVIYGVYVFMRPIQKQDHLTPRQIESLTAYKASDTTLVTTLKSSALAAYLATGDTSKIKQLKNTFSKVESLTSGNLPSKDVAKTLKYLTEVYKLQPKQVSDLENSYKNANLKLNISKLNHLVDTANLTQWQLILKYAETVHDVAKQQLVSYLQSSNAPYPDQVNDAIAALTNLNNKVAHATAFNDLFINPSTTLTTDITSFGELTNFEKPFESQFVKLLKYTQVRDRIMQHNADLKAFKQTVDAATILKDRTIPLEDWVGKTLGEAKGVITAKGYKYKLADGSNASDDAKIIEQYPKLQDFASITKNSTITLRTEPKAPDVVAIDPNTTTSTEPSSASQPGESKDKDTTVSETKPTESSSTSKPVEINRN